MVRFYRVFAFRMFELVAERYYLVAAIQICIQNWKTCISPDIYQKTQQNKTPNRTLTEDYQFI